MNERKYKTNEKSAVSAILADFRLHHIHILCVEGHVLDNYISVACSDLKSSVSFHTRIQVKKFVHHCKPRARVTMTPTSHRLVLNALYSHHFDEVRANLSARFFHLRMNRDVRGVAMGMASLFMRCLSTPCS